MTDPTEDPRIDAYVADELTDSERTEFEARLAADPDLRRLVDETRHVVTLLQRGFAVEAQSTPATRAATSSPAGHRGVRAFPWRVGIAAGLVVVAGTSAVLIQQKHRPRVAADLQPTVQTPLSHSGEIQTNAPRGTVEPDPQRRKGQEQPQQEALNQIVNTPAESQPAARTRSPALLKELPAVVTAGKKAELAANGLEPALVATGQSDKDGAAGGPPNPSDLQKRFAYKLADASGGQDGSKSKDRSTPQAYGRGVAAVPPTATVQLRTLADAEHERLAGVPIDAVRAQSQPSNTEAYDRITDNPFLDVRGNPLSTFSIDVDTASYANVRRFLTAGQLPPKDSVRIEELVNYFPYDYAPPTDPEKPFAAHVEVAACPWNNDHRLVRVGIKGRVVQEDQRPATNLVFLIDVSGSMQDANKLPLLKRSLRLLVERLGEKDRVAMVVYAGSSGLVLPSTSCDPGSKHLVLDALEKLEAGGSTNGAQGIELAYQTATQSFVQGAVNRVVLCTDGDFNVGVTNQGDLTRLIEDKAKTGVFLSVLGFGMGNLKDSTMEKLADKGNGNYAYVDTINEAKKVLVEQMNGTLVTIAKDVKIQVEFNPAAVASYRLVGYENRLLAKEDFNDDTKDAGEIGAGHTVTALYEIVAPGQPTTLPGVDPLKYQPNPATNPAAGANADELLTLKLRYKAPDGEKSVLTEFPVRNESKPFARATPDFKFASAVAGFGMLLRQSPHKGDATFAAVQEWAQEGIGNDPSGYRQEFLGLIQRAQQAAGVR